MNDDPIKKAASDLLRTATVMKIKRDALEAAEKAKYEPQKGRGSYLPEKAS
jgi:hypothetical protein